MDIILIQQHLTKLYNELNHVDEKGNLDNVYTKEANAKITFKSLERQEKNVLAHCILEIKEGAQNSKESQARCSDKWKDFCKGLDNAESEFLKASALVKGFDTKFEILRSLNKDYKI